MKQLIWKLVLPSTIISFFVFTKWWYVEINGSKEILTGFPLPYRCPAWHTSLALQVFVFPLIVDIMTYFAFWFTVILVAYKFIEEIRLGKVLTRMLLSVSGILTAAMIFIGSSSDNIYTFKRGFDIEVLESGYKMFWQIKHRSDYHN